MTALRKKRYEQVNSQFRKDIESAGATSRRNTDLYRILPGALVLMRIDIENVTKRFGTLAAVNQVTLSIQEGELLTLLGPSGCGKSTCCG